MKIFRKTDPSCRKTIVVDHFVLLKFMLWNNKLKTFSIKNEKFIFKHPPACL